jgi:hypothetical protein
MEEHKRKLEIVAEYESIIKKLNDLEKEYSDAIKPSDSLRFIEESKLASFVSRFSDLQALLTNCTRDFNKLAYKEGNDIKKLEFKKFVDNGNFWISRISIQYIQRLQIEQNAKIRAKNRKFSFLYFLAGIILSLLGSLAVNKIENPNTQSMFIKELNKTKYYDSIFFEEYKNEFIKLDSIIKSKGDTIILILK